MLLHRRVTAGFRVALPTTMEPLTLTGIDAARALGISRTKAYAMGRSGEVPKARVGGAVAFPTPGLRARAASRSRMPRESAFPENHDGTRISASPKHR